MSISDCISVHHPLRWPQAYAFLRRGENGGQR